jgi:hypothetical protein
MLILFFMGLFAFAVGCGLGVATKRLIYNLEHPKG